MRNESLSSIRGREHQSLISDFDKIYWSRVILGMITGIAAAFISASDSYNGIVLGLLIYLVSYYVIRLLWGKRFKPQEMQKVYTTGLGTYVMLYLFFWLLLFTFSFVIR
jgi:hypothetical protein